VILIIIDNSVIVKERVLKSYMQYDSIYVTLQKKQNDRNRKATSVCKSLEYRGRGRLQIAENIWGYVILLNLDLWLYDCRYLLKFINLCM
jgi:hypothetical protein